MISPVIHGIGAVHYSVRVSSARLTAVGQDRHIEINLVISEDASSTQL